MEATLCHQLSGMLLFAAVGMAAVVDTIDVDLTPDTLNFAGKASGFHGSFSDAVPESLLAPLKPKLVRRYNDRTWELAERLGTTVHVLLPGYDYGHNNDWQGWVRHVTELVNTARAHRRTVDYAYDIWNEPDKPNFWQRTPEEFYDWWRRTHVLLRSLDPDARIVGPSAADFAWITGFLTYAKDNDCVPDVLSWHEMKIAGKYIRSHVLSAANFMKMHGIAVQGFSINEYNGWKPNGEDVWPGHAIGYFATMERDSRILHAAKAYYRDRGGDPSNLNGLLTHEDKLPRSMWWAYYEYAQLQGTLARVTRKQNIDAVVVIDEAGQRVRGVFGRFGGFTEEPTGGIDVRLRNTGRSGVLPAAGTVRVVVRHIPNSGASALQSPTTVVDRDYTVSSGSLVVTVPDVGPRDAFVMTIQPKGPVTGINYPAGDQRLTVHPLAHAETHGHLLGLLNLGGRHAAFSHHAVGMRAAGVYIRTHDGLTMLKTRRQHLSP
ncbi:MAG: hypothetical protein GF331_01890 [Chitinivibrionales bacterium]|nr:hypothetical protein [Chitinivibrionales bacterium]